MSVFGPMSGQERLVRSPLGTRIDPYLGFSFLVEVEDLIVGGFSEVSGLQVETEVQP